MDPSLRWDGSKKMFFPSRLHYFSHEINTEVKEVYWNAFIVNFALSITTLFEPIFLYGLGYSLVDILWFYCAVYLAYSVLVFAGGKVISWIGYKHAIFWSNIFYIIYWVMLYQLKFHPELFLIAPIYFALQKSFMWPAYHADIAKNSIKDQRGREVGLLFSLIQAASIVGPLLGGLISAFLGFKALFFVSSVLMLLSAYPLFRSSEIYTKHSFHFRNFWKILKTYPQNFFGYWGYAEDLMLMTLWPLYVFLAVPALLNVGLLVTVASFIAIVIMLYLGRFIDHQKKSHVLQIASIAYGLTWLVRQFAVGFPAVFVFDALTRTGKALLNVPMTALTYKLAGQGTANYAIAHAVFVEFSLSVGKVVTALLCIWILSATQNIYYAFIVAGGLTMFYGLLSSKKR